MRCPSCGQDISAEDLACQNCQIQNSQRRGVGATVGFAAGQAVGWLKNRPWLLAGLGLILIVVITHRHSESSHHQKVQVAQTRVIAAPLPANAPPKVPNGTPEPSSVTRPQSSSLLTADYRQRLAKVLETSFAQQDLDVTAVAAGDANDTLIFTSETFNDVNQRVVFMQLLRRNWEKELCKSGFKLVNLSKPGFFGDSQEFTLRCPRTAQERKEFVASVQDDMRKEGNAIQVVVSGGQNEVLVFRSDSFATEQARKTFFGMLRKRMQQPLCDYGFRSVELHADGSSLQAGRFTLNCVHLRD
jgi:hypothetical protein